MWAALELFGPHPFVSPDSPCLSLRCCLTLGGLGWGILALMCSTCLFSVTYCSLSITCLTCFSYPWRECNMVCWRILFGAYAGILYHEKSMKYHGRASHHHHHHHQIWAHLQNKLPVFQGWCQQRWKNDLCRWARSLWKAMKRSERQCASSPSASLLCLVTSRNSKWEQATAHACVSIRHPIQISIN